MKIAWEPVEERSNGHELKSNYAAARARLMGRPASTIIIQPELPPEPPRKPPPEPPIVATVCAARDPERFIVALIEMLQPLSNCTVHNVLRAVAHLSGLSVAELLENDRRNVRVCPRQIGMAVSVIAVRRCSLPQIGHIFGGRDHTTVLHAVWRWRDRVEPILQARETK